MTARVDLYARIYAADRDASSAGDLGVAEQLTDALEILRAGMTPAELGELPRRLEAVDQAHAKLREFHEGRN